MPWRGPRYPGEVPTLGWYAIDWLERYLIVPDGPLAGAPLTLTREQAAFVLALYAVDPWFDGQPIRGAALHNARRVRRAVLSRPKGWGKSPLLAGLTLLEALADVVPDGWDADGEPVGRSWVSLGFKAKAQLVAVSEDQTVNTWEPLLEMARNGPVLDAYGLDPLNTFVVVPRGIIEFVTSSGTSREGFRPIFSVLDQTESWSETNGGVKLAATIRRNLAKTQGASIETPNAFIPMGERGSVAERSWKAYLLQREGRTRGTGILADHREAPGDTDPTDLDSLRAGLAVSYGDSADVAGGWVSLDRIVQDYWDPDTDPADARRFYLNQVISASDAWITAPEWGGCRAKVPVEIGPKEPVTLGFDGSRSRAGRSTTDATALIGCRVRDGHLFTIRVWEQPEGPAGRDWRVPTVEVEAEVRSAFTRYNVVGFYADPAKWESYVAGWESEYGAGLTVKASRSAPIEWWMTGGRGAMTARALESLRSAVEHREITHDGSSVLTRHVLAARKRPSTQGMQIAKEHPDSENKIDAAVAAVLAYQARLDALALPPPTETATYAPRRVR